MEVTAMSSFKSKLSNRWSLHGHTALVTGGSKGLGYAVVEELAGLGAVVHTCSRNQQDINKCLNEWKEKGLKVTGSVCDLSSAAERVKLMETVSSQFNGKLNILVNNAGLYINKPTVEFTDEDYSIQMSTNFESAYSLSRMAHPLLKSSGEGNIILMSSVAGISAVQIGCIYGITKAAMLIEQALEDEEFKKAAVARTPMGRTGEPVEAAGLTAFLCLPAASYVTGQTVAVDGGTSVHCFTPPGTS
ncbi:Tropinone reductase homolog At1g07440 [Linum perenne]